MTEYRIEKDSLGEVKVPAEAMYGAQTARALENFQISGIRFPRVFIYSLALLKGAAADVNKELGLLENEKACAIRQAADEVVAGIWDDHFPLDIFQTGSGTSTNMNANEVIARRAEQLLAAKSGPGGLVHPNNDVNMGQSSNDVIPSAIHISAYFSIRENLLTSLVHLKSVLEKKAAESSGLVKTGRTHLMDAMPISLGQEIGGWAFQVGRCVGNIESGLTGLSELAIGGTAVGTGINTHAQFGSRVAEKISQRTGIAFKEAENHFAAQTSMDAALEMSGHLKTTATVLTKIANDLRLMNSGPISGLGEITLPPLQPGSSIMPGKINPVICESVIMVSAQVIGNDAAITIANSRGEFELNVMLPLIAHNLLQSITIMGNAARHLADKAIAGFTANEKKLTELVDRNPILVTALVPKIGYDRASEIAKKAYAEGRSIRDVAAEMTDLSPEELDKILDPRKMTGPGI